MIEYGCRFQKHDKFMSTDLKDCFNKPIQVGDLLIKPGTWLDSPSLWFCKVTEIRNGKIYLDNSKVPIQYPGRCMVYKEQVIDE